MRAKLRFDAISDAALADDADLRFASATTKARTITVSDTRMSRQEVIDHIGTIAKSGP
jgi:HSP90 family molecular chaperone